MMKKKIKDKSFDDLYAKCISMSFEEKKELAVKASGIVINYLNGNYDERESEYIYLKLIGSLIGVDSDVNQAEFKFCQTVFGFTGTFDAFYCLAKASITQENVDFLNSLIDASPHRIKTAFVTLAIVFCAYDGIIPDSEKKLIQKYID